MLFGIFNQNSFKKFTTVCIVFASLVIVANLALSLMGSNTLPEESIVLYAQKPTKLYMPFGGLKGDTVTCNISRGDSVWLLGVEKDKVRYWVADAQGQRGYVNQEDFDSCMVIHSLKRVKDKIKPYLGDTVQIVKPLRKRDEFLCRLPNDSTIEVKGENLFGLTAIKYEKYITEGNYTTHMSMKRLERELKTSNIVSADSIGKLARVIAKTKSGWLARYNITAVDSNGVKYYPIVAFDSNGQFAKVDMKVKTYSGSFLLSLLPFVDTIADSGFLESLIDEPIYNFNLNVSEYPTWLYYICWVLVLLFGLVVFAMWVQGTALLPMFVVMGMTRFSWAFKPLPDMALKIIAFVFAFVGIYLWVVSIGLWGMPWWLSLPLLIGAAAYPLFEYSLHLSESIPHERCPQCRHLDSLSYSYEENTGTHITYEEESVNCGKVGESRREWDTYDVKTTRWSDGRTTQEISNKQHHVKVEGIYYYDVYKVKYRVHDIYRHYVCHHCKHDERDYSPKYEELDREYLRSYTR